MVSADLRQVLSQDTRLGPKSKPLSAKLRKLTAVEMDERHYIVSP